MSLLTSVTGHQKQKHILLSLLSRKKVATTYLFTGESGTGKRLAALEFAKTVNCITPVETDGYTDSCGVCSSCRKYSSLTHPDLKVIEPEGGMIKIERIREIREFLSFSSFEGKKKVVLVDDAETLNPAASNAFLKTLEEPTPDSMIILVTMSPDMLLETIRSRCFTIRFSPLNREETLSVIRPRTEGMDDETVEQLVRLSMGRPGILFREEGLSLLDDMEIMAGCLERSDLTMQSRERSELEGLLNRLIIALRDILILRVTGEEGGPLITPLLSERLYRVSKKMDVQDIIRLYNGILMIMRDLKYNLNSSVVLNYLSASIKECYGNSG